MKQARCGLILSLLIACLLAGAIGCKKANPDDIETKAIALQFFKAIFNTHDADLAMSVVGPIQTFGFVTRDIVESTIDDYVKNRCTTIANSVSVGQPGSDVIIPEITEADAAKGITARAAWFVASKYRCGSQSYDADHITLVHLNKIDGKWGISKAEMYFGVNYWP
jgi:hypothetical protein